MDHQKRLFRSEQNRMIAGVCGGLGAYFGIDPTLVRIVWLALTVFGGILPGLLIYLTAIIVIPDETSISA